MFFKRIIFFLILGIFYQNPLHSKSNSLNDFDGNNLSKYFSGIVALENKDNSRALQFLSSSKILLNKHNPYLKKYVYSLVLEDKVSQAINVVKRNLDKENSDFLEAHLLLILDSLKKGQFNKAYDYSIKAINSPINDRFNLAIIKILKQYIYVFKEKKFLKNKEDFGKLSNISETFQKCYLVDKNTDLYFNNLISDSEGDYSRYYFFYISYLVENNRLAEAQKLSDNIEYINSTLLLSQGKSWLDNGNEEKFTKFFSCENHDDIISEFFFLISNLYSSQDDFDKSNFFLNLSNFSNPKFIFNLSLVVENQYLNGEFKKAKKNLKKFKKDNLFYYWYRVKKEALIIDDEEGLKKSLQYIESEFKKIDDPNNKMLFDIANFFKNSKEYQQAIDYYTILINKFNDNLEIKADLLYRRGGSYERIGKYKTADKDFLYSLKLDPNDAYVLNYLAYSWLERNYKIDNAIEMLEKAYSLENDDPYIIDSIGWAYYLTKDYSKAEKFLKRAVLLMPDDPIVNDHYGDILWKLNRKIQARYFWSNVLKMEDAEKKIIKSINKKMIDGPQNS
tara:strand:- start:261 stop:1946 length:1686 start_codon:yes stop_codon:yes gene_type:complete